MNKNLWYFCTLVYANLLLDKLICYILYSMFHSRNPDKSKDTSYVIIRKGVWHYSDSQNNSHTLQNCKIGSRL